MIGCLRDKRYQKGLDTKNNVTVEIKKRKRARVKGAPSSLRLSWYRFLPKIKKERR